MTTDLETALRTAAKSGRLNHVSVGWINGKWSGSYRGVENRDGRIFDHDDIVSALIGAITGRKMPAPEVVKKVRKKVDEVKDEYEDLL